MSWLAILAAAAEGGDENTGVIFYVGGSVLAVFAVLVGVVGLNRRFDERGARAVMAIGALLAAAAMATAVLGAA